MTLLAYSKVVFLISDSKILMNARPDLIITITRSKLLNPDPFQIAGFNIKIFYSEKKYCERDIDIYKDSVDSCISEIDAFFRKLKDPFLNFLLSNQLFVASQEEIDRMQEEEKENILKFVLVHIYYILVHCRNSIITQKYRLISLKKRIAKLIVFLKDNKMLQEALDNLLKIDKSEVPVSKFREIVEYDERKFT